MAGGRQQAAGSRQQDSSVALTKCVAQRLDGRAPAQEILSKGLDAFDGPPRDKVLKGVARFILR